VSDWAARLVARNGEACTSTWLPFERDDGAGTPGRLALSPFPTRTRLSNEVPLTCPSCGQANPEASRFCLACGSRLIEEGTTRGARTTITVVFSDVVGSSSLGETLDTESLSEVMSRYFDRMRRVIRRYGGTVEKFIGDAVVAVFGFPRVHEDDALRAVRAAQEMQFELRDLNTELISQAGVALQIRTGVNTGEVLVGALAPGSNFAAGDVMNTAARLQQLASPGEILLGQATWRLVRDAIEAQPIEPTSVKGKAEPVSSWRLVRVVPGAEAIPRHLDSSLVGRETDLSLLVGSFHKAVRDSAVQFVTIVGEPGVGKTRLVRELRRSIDAVSTEPVGWRQGRCLPYGEGITFWALGEIVKAEAAILENDSSDVVAAKIDATIPESHQQAAWLRQRLRPLVGLPAPPADREENFAAWRTWLEALAGRPAVLVFEDLQWGDEALLAFVHHVANNAENVPMLLLGTARPDLLDRVPDFCEEARNTQRVTLAPLGEFETGTLVAQLLHQAGLPKPLRSRILKQAAGNPLYAEEFVRLLKDRSIRDEAGEKSSTEGGSNDLPVPDTIVALIAARLDLLPPVERVAAEYGSVEGELFHRGAVEAIGDGLDIGGSLDGLTRRDLIHPAQAQLAGEAAFGFKHALVRDAAYRGIAKRFRANLHERFADWLERRAADRVAEVEEIVGYHLERAFRYRVELGPPGEVEARLAERAARVLWSAGGRALVLDNAAALRLLTRAAEILPVEHPLRPRILLAVVEALVDGSELERAPAVALEARDLAAAHGDRGTEALASLYHVQSVAQVGGGSTWLQDSVEAAREAVSVFEDLGDDSGLAEACILLSDIRRTLGQFQLAAEASQRAVDHAQQGGDETREAWARLRLVYSEHGGRTPIARALRSTQEVAAGLERMPQIRGWVVHVWAVQLAMSGRPDLARERLAEAVRVRDQIGFRHYGVDMSRYAAEVERLAGDLAAAEAILREAASDCEEIGERLHFASIAADLAHVLYARGVYEEAERYSELSKRVMLAHDCHAEIRWRSALAKVLARRGASEQAERLAREAVSLAAETDAITWYAHALVDLAEVLRLARKPGDAASTASAALALYERKGNVVDARAVRRLLSFLSP
jgi:class 3 adenylate cyclase/tetratricopeptide (TPR) repeat protein